MSKISLEPNVSGAGTFTLAAPNSNTNRTLTLPDESGTIFSDGTGVSGSAVTGQLASSNMPAGSMIQVVSATKTNTFSATLSSAGEESGTVTGLTASITPSSASSKVLVRVFVNLGVEGHALAGVAIILFRDSTKIGIGADTSSTQVSSAGYNADSEDRIITNVGFEIEDDPSSTSETTYSIKLVRQTGGSTPFTFYVNRAQDTGTDARFSTASTITAMEIAG